MSSAVLSSVVPARPHGAHRVSSSRDELSSRRAVVPTARVHALGGCGARGARSGRGIVGVGGGGGARFRSKDLRSIAARAFFQRGDDVYEERDNDGPAIKVEISMKDVKKGKRIGSGSFGDVFEGKYKGQGVVMKERKLTAQGKRFFDSEAALNRRLKNSAGVASFVGVGGADAYLIWKDEGRATLDTVLNGRGGQGRRTVAHARRARYQPPQQRSETYTYLNLPD